MEIIFIGTSEFAAIILEELIKKNYQPILVITAPDKPVGRKQIIAPPPVKVVANKYNIPVEQSSEIKNLKLKIKNLNPDLGIVASFGQIIPSEILNIPKFGCLNIHPSLLPKYRGPSPIQAAILNGDKETGVTIIKMTEKVDAGPIVSKIKYKITNNKINYPELHNQLAKMGADLLIKTIPLWTKEKIKEKLQDEKKASYTKILKKEDGLINWQDPPEVIERKIRALNPWPGTYTIYHGKMLKILEAEIINNQLIIKRVQLEGKKPMEFKDFFRGHPDFNI
ncbi:MAG: methionyl-tRNA formyltransferase [Minisyncoccales bacterium]